MKRCLPVFLGIILIGISSFVWEQKKILIIGDSISIGYTPFVWKYFQGKALVTHNPGNAQHTGTGLEKIDEWIGSDDWDLIQLNWGLWDLAYVRFDEKNVRYRDKVNGKVTFSPEEYAANLDQLVTRIKQLTDAKLVFVTTTYVPNEEIGRFTEDPEKYNAAAKAVMAKHRVPVNDIYEASIAIHQEEGLGNDDVHYSTKGSEALGKLITSFLEKELENSKLPSASKEQ